MNFFYFLDVDGCLKKYGVLPFEPRVKHAGMFGDAGVDLFSPIHVIVPPHSQVKVNSFVGFVFDPGTAAFMAPRGGDSFLLGSGIIDTGYSGTVVSRIINPYDEEIVIERGDSIGQLVPFLKAHSDGITLVKKNMPSPEMFSGRRGFKGRIHDED